MAREWFNLECSECSTRYYRTSKEKTKQAKLEIKKFCPSCRKHTLHKERKK
ncbi:MAG: 50S ribosomal protein L33 [Planctomycetes bacterium]|nr:50S ribosomal protein L33 [Planctomycetota bacterium]